MNHRLPHTAAALIHGVTYCCQLISLHLFTLLVLCSEQIRTLYRNVDIRDYSGGSLMLNGTHPLQHTSTNKHLSPPQFWCLCESITDVSHAKQGHQDDNIANHENKTSGYPKPSCMICAQNASEITVSTRQRKVGSTLAACEKYTYFENIDLASVSVYSVCYEYTPPHHTLVTCRLQLNNIYETVAINGKISVTTKQKC